MRLKKRRFLKAELVVLLCVIAVWTVSSGAIDGVKNRVLKQVIEINPDADSKEAKSNTNTIRDLRSEFIQSPAGMAGIIRDEETGQVSYVPQQQQVVIDQQPLQILRGKLEQQRNFLQQQYNMELEALRKTSRNEKEFRSNVAQLIAKTDIQLNKFQFQHQQQIQQIRQIQNLINDNKISIQAGNEAMWRLVLPQETEAAMFPTQERFHPVAPKPHVK